MSTLGPSRSAKSTVRPQPNNACDVARRSLPDGAFGMVPGSSTTMRGRTVTSETAAWAGAAWSGWRRASKGPAPPGRSRLGSPASTQPHHRVRFPRRPGRPRCPLVHLIPGVPDRRIRLAGQHVVRTGPGMPVHSLGESAHRSNLPGEPSVPTLSLRPRARSCAKLT